jgi:flagellar basal body-associated protein FliL
MIHIITRHELINFLWIIIVLLVGIAILWLSTYMAEVTDKMEEEEQHRNESFEDSEKQDG